MDKIYKRMAKSNRQRRLALGIAGIFVGFLLIFIEMVYGAGDFSILCIIGAIFIVVGVSIIGSYLTGGYKKAFMEKMAYYNISEYDLECDIKNAITLSGEVAEIGDKYIVSYGFSPNVIPFEILVWAFIFTHVTETYGGDITRYSIKVVDRAGGTHEISCNSEQDAKAGLEIMKKKAPYLIFGYDTKISYRAKENFDEMIQEVDEARSKMKIF